MKHLPVIAALAALALAGTGAAAVLLHTIHLKPGSCVTLKTANTRVCANKVTPATVTVAPSPVGRSFSGSGQQTLAPFTLAQGTMLHWTITNDPYALGLSIYYDGGIISSGNATSGQSYLAPGTYTLQINAAGDWTISF